MAHLRSRRRPALAVPVVLSLTASLGFLPGAASAAPRAAPAVSAADGPSLAYVVNTRPDHRSIESVKKATAEAGGTVVITYDKIGVIVVHSANPDFGPQIRAVRGVQSAGATRTTPLTAAGTTDEGAADYLSAAETTKVEAAGAPESEPLEADQWYLRAIGADKAARIDPGSKKVTVGVIDMQGTSMASPHASGVAALLKSTYPWATPAQLQALLKAQADNPGCPDSYDQDGNGTQDATREGGQRVNGFYGFGIVNALKAVE